MQKERFRVPDNCQNGDILKEGKVRKREEGELATELVYFSNHVSTFKGKEKTDRRRNTKGVKRVEACALKT